MLLALDVGNTHTVLGVYSGSDLIDRWRVTTHQARTADELSVLLKSLFDSSKVVSADEIDAAIVSSVVPSVTQRIVEMADRLFDVRCRVVGPGLKTGMPILYEDPREVGADRIVNAVAAFDRWPEGLIIVAWPLA